MATKHEQNDGGAHDLDSRRVHPIFDEYLNLKTTIKGKMHKWIVRTNIDFFLRYVNDFTPEQQWIVENHITTMRHEDSIDLFKKGTQCDVLSLPNKSDYYAIKMAEDGFGKNHVKLTIYVKPPTIWIINAHML